MTYHEAIAAYLSNLTARAKRLGVARDTLYKWRANPDTANLRLIRNDLAAQLTAINGRLAGIEGKTTAHGLQIAEGGELEVQILNIAQ